MLLNWGAVWFYFLNYHFITYLYMSQHLLFCRWFKHWEISIWKLFFTELILILIYKDSRSLTRYLQFSGWKWWLQYESLIIRCEKMMITRYELGGEFCALASHYRVINKGISFKKYNGTSFQRYCWSSNEPCCYRHRQPYKTIHCFSRRFVAALCDQNQTPVSFLHASGCFNHGRSFSLKNW